MNKVLRYCGTGVLGIIAGVSIVVAIYGLVTFGKFASYNLFYKDMVEEQCITREEFDKFMKEANKTLDKCRMLLDGIDYHGGEIETNMEDIKI